MLGSLKVWGHFGKRFVWGINMNEMRGLGFIILDENRRRLLESLGLGFVFTGKLEIGSGVALRRLLGLAKG